MKSPVRDSDSRNVYLAAGTFLDVSADELADIVLRVDGCDGIGLRLSGEHAIDTSPQAVDLRSRLAAGGKRVFDAEVVRVTADFMADSAISVIARAAEVGASQVLVVSDLAASDRAGRDPRSALDASIEAFSALTDLARSHGIAVAVEYMAWTTPCDVDGALRVHADTGCRVVVDLLHHTRIGATVADLQRLVAADAVAWVQICDAPATLEAVSLLSEARHGRLTPGAGALPLRDYLSVIPKSIDVSIEVQSDVLSAVEPSRRASQLLAATHALLD